ncbi:MAG: hypothetical protein L0958_02620 [Candidatus Mariimomonas ferrooxydans]
MPESFHVLIKELQSLGLDIELLEEKPLEQAVKRKLTLAERKARSFERAKKT